MTNYNKIIQVNRSKYVGILSFLLILIGVFINAPKSFAASAGDWHNNLLKEDHGIVGELRANMQATTPTPKVFGVEAWNRDEIQAIYVLDTLKDIPADAVDISATQDGSVMGWVDPDRVLYIAGEGGVMAPENSNALFAWFNNAKIIDLGGNLHTDMTTKMSFLFCGCSSLENLNLYGIVTDNVQYFTKVFAGCRSLKTIDLTGFHTQNAVRFFGMFLNCESLETLDLTSFQSSAVDDFQIMFRGCTSLREIRWDSQLFSTISAVNMSQMFYDCNSLESVDVSLFDTSNVVNMYMMFSRCFSLKYLETSYWAVNPNNTDTGDMFAEAYLEDIYGRNGELLFDINQVESSGMMPSAAIAGGENRYTAEEAASILHRICDSYASEGTTSYIQDEYLEDEHTYVVWFRSYTAFTTQFRADLITGDVIQSGPYNGKDPDTTLPFSEEYAFNLAEYENELSYDIEDDRDLYWDDEEYTLEDNDYNMIDNMLNGIPVKLGDSMYLDVDMDGEPEDIFLEFEEEPYTDNGETTFYYGRYWLSVDGEYLEGEGENLHDSLYGVSLDGETIDLVVYQEGPSEDPVCEFYHYDGISLTYAGRIEDAISNLVITSDHIVISELRTNIMDTSSIVVCWEKQEDGFLYPIEQDYYDMHNELAEHMNKGLYYATLLYPIEVYEDRDYESECYYLLPQAVRFPYTDNQNWVYVEAEDGSGGWLDVSDWDYEDRWDYFEGLLFAG